jgi:hypothetical protein
MLSPPAAAQTIGKLAPAAADASESDVGAPVAKEITADIGAPESMTAEARLRGFQQNGQFLPLPCPSTTRCGPKQSAKRAQTAKKIKKRTRIG